MEHCNEFVEARGVVEPRLISGELIWAEELGHGLAVHSAGRTPVASVLDDGPDEVATLAHELRTFDPSPFDPAALREHAERFSSRALRDGLRAHVEAALIRGA